MNCIRIAPAVRTVMLALMACVTLLAGCSSSPSEPSEPEIRRLPVLGGLAADKATIYIFNIGEGSFLGTGRGQTITDNGTALVTVPRESYVALTLDPGPHRFGNEFDGRRTLLVDLRPGQVYYLVIGFKPEPAWAKPLAVDGFVFGQTSEARARELAGSYTRIQQRR